jgi:alpha-ribazole phosphatase
MKTYKLHLIRHGLTRANLEGFYAGAGTDLPLCPEGIAQLEQLHKKYAYPKVSLVLTSPLMRARQSADILFPGVKQIGLSDLREIDFGDFEGKNAAQLQGLPAFHDWLDPKKQATPPNGESGADFARRCSLALQRTCEFLLKSETREIAVVTHGGLIMTALAMHAVPQREPQLWACDPGCGFTVQTTAANYMRDGVVEALNILPYGYLDEEEA